MSQLLDRLRARIVPSTEPSDGGVATTLADLPCGRCAVILGFTDRAPAEVVRRLFDLGFVPGAEIAAVRRAPMVDPVVFTVAGYEIALRRAQAGLIAVDAAA